MKQSFDKLRQQIQKNESVIMMGMVLVLGLSLTLSFLAGKKQIPEAAASTPMSIDTLIPPGLALVPLELANGPTLSSLFSDFAIVDLFETSEDGKKVHRKVGQRLRLIRSHSDPEKMAVLVPKGQEVKLLQFKNPLFAVLQNPSQLEEANLPTYKTAPSRIQYID